MADEEDFSALPLEQRLGHKVWKVRMNAYNDLAKELKQLDPEREAGQFSNYEGYLSKMVLDTNMAAQEAGILAVAAFVENAPNPTRRREEIVAGIVGKCLSATKAGTRTSSKELLLLLSEVDTPGPVVTGVIEGFDAKQPKAVAAAVTAVKEIVHAFGIKFIGLKPLLKSLAKPFAHKDNAVRTEAQHLTVELYRWMGPAIMPSLQDLPPVLLKELETQFSGVAKDPPPKQERLLRSQQEADEPAESAPTDAGNGDGDDADERADAGPGMDPWDLADAVDITKKLPDEYYELIGSKKWKERKEVIEALFEALKKSIRLQMNPGTGDVIQELGKKIADTNIIVATLAIQCLEKLASGLRQPFAPYVQSTLPALVEKSKERKQTVVDAIRATTDAYFAAAGCDMTAIGDHYFTGATHKNPQVRAESHHFLRRCLAVIPTRPGKGDIKRYADQLKAGLEDGDAGVREASAECLGTLSKLVTPKVLDPFIGGVEKLKLDKITEYAEKATIKAKAAPKPRAPAPAAAPGKPRPRPRAPPKAAPAPTSSPVVEDDAPAGVSANLPPHIRKKLEASARAAAIKKAQREGRPIDDLLPPPEPVAAPVAPKPAAPKRPVAAAPPARKPVAPAAAAGKPRGAVKAGASEAVKLRFANDESLDEKIASALPAPVLESLASAKWKDRMEAMDQLREFLSDEAARGSGVHPELVVRQLSRKPGWKESNFQVSARAFQLIAWMAGEDELDFNTGAAALSIPALVDKLGDIKLKGPAGDALTAIAERFSLQFVVGLALDPIRAQKSPKVVADCLTWLNTQLLEFGVQGVGLRAVADMARDAGLQSSNAQTRATAVTLMGTLRRAVGTAVMDLVGDLNPQLVQLLDTEFARVSDQAMPEPTRTQRSAAVSKGPGQGAAPVSQDSAMDDLFPRQDLHATVGAAVYKQLGDSNWKVRKAALDAIQGALAATNNRIQPGVSGDLYTALKQRLQDPNKNLTVVALTVLGALSEASGAALVPNIRIVALATMHCLSDKKPQVRTAALGAMAAWAAASSASVDQAVLPALPTALGDTSPELRASLLQWVADTLGARSPRLPDLALLITPLFACLQDRTAAVRKQAMRVLALTVASCGFEAVYDACAMQLRGAARTTVAPMIEEFRHTVGASVGSPRPASVAPPRARAVSPVPAEPVMTASELLGRAPVSTSAPPVPAQGPGVLRRPMAVRRPGAPAARPVRADPGRPGSSLRSATPTASLTSQLSRMSDEELDRVPPILDSDARAKDLRARRDAAANPHGVARWAQLGDARVRSDLEAQLREQCAAHFNPLVMRQLFSTGHYKDRDYLGGLSALDDAVSMAALTQQRFGLALHDEAGADSLAARYAANRDILLKYVSLRMYDGSTHTLLKSFDLLERLIQLAEDAEQGRPAAWIDYEVQAVVPALISRLGDAKEAVRTRARRVLTQLITRLYPATKLSAALLEHGVANRASARVRAEALDCVCYLVRERTAGLGLSAVFAQPARAVPIIVQGVGDRDSGVRTATLNVLVAIGEQLPGGADDLWRLCGRMPEKERCMLEERLKRSTIGVGSGSGSGFGSAQYGDAMAARPSSRIGAPPMAGARSRLGQPQSGVPGPRSSSSIGRPMSQNAVSRNGSATIAAGVGASRLTRPPASQPAPYTSEAPSSAKPMFSLDFDNLNLPSYSSATSEQLGASRGLGVRMDSAMTPSSSDHAAGGIGYGVGRSERLRSALSGLYGGSSPMAPMRSSSPGLRRPTDFASMSDVERDQWISAAVADMRGNDPHAADSAVERMQGLMRTIEGSGDVRHYSPALAHMRKHISVVCGAIAALVQWAYTTENTDAALEPALHRIRRDAVGLLLDIFTERRLALWVPQPAIQTLLQELVQRLVDPLLSPTSRARDAEAALPSGAQLHKAINGVMVKILERADRTAVLVALVNLLDVATHAPVPNPPESVGDILRADMGDIVMRCLWRLSKNLPEDLRVQFGDYAAADVVPDHAACPRFGDPSRCQTIRIDAILLATHRFFRHTPNSEWHKRENKEKWTSGDLPKRTVKTISHTFAIELHGLAWQFVGLVVREVMREQPSLLTQPPTSDLRVAAWADEMHLKLSGASEAWEYLARALQTAGGEHDRPTPSQMLAAFHAAQADESDDDPVADTMSVRSPALSVASSVHAESLPPPPYSPVQPPRAMYQPTPEAKRARSPASSDTYAPAPLRPAGSSLDRLRALRERIGGIRPPATSTLREPVASVTPPISSVSPPLRGTEAEQQSSAPQSSTSQSPAPAQAQSIDDIKQRIALMRNSLRSRK
ncbi:hypothetical protein GGH15_000794 [Coemansia sp. RSA 562]|nr:hypothetical protein IW142_003430 [Coemansia sp. RSA 564]KAJ2169172.1 hypothetical protein GGH15_000794 [Coemansia sp. RSA 562]KAJ2293771.1 hypothetical protein IW141_000829 [Coemansia sp. RSA 355]KAJ2410834.1 hypothetical protein J3F80_000188 [Coemansia sp. RSA 2526]